MPYCFKCGVKVDNGVKKCPLCKLELPVFEDEKIIEPRYPSQENVFKEIKKRRRNVFFTIYSMVIIAIVINLLFIDWRDNNTLSWAIYSTIYLIGSLVYLIAILQYYKDSKINFIIIGANTLLLLFLNDYVNGKIDWFYTLAGPITIFSTIASYCIFKIFKSKKLLPYKIIGSLLIIAIFLISIELVINKFLFNSFFVNWSLQTTIYFLPAITILIFMPKRVYEKTHNYFKRKLHM